MSYFGVYKDDEIAVPCAVVEDIFHYAVHEKLAFVTSWHVSLGNGASENISFKTPDSTTYLHLMYRFHGSQETTLQIQEGAVITASTGVVHPVFSRNRVPTVPDTAVLENTTGSYVAGNAQLGGTIGTPGTVINGSSIGEHVGAGKDGGELQSAFEYVFAPDTVYAIVLTNHTAQTDEAYVELDWFEVPQA